MSNLYELKINRSNVSLGVNPSDIMFSFKALKGKVFTFSLFSHGIEQLLYTRTLSAHQIICFYPDYSFAYSTEYCAQVVNEFGDSISLEFETAALLNGKCIMPKGDATNPVFCKTFTLDTKSTKNARLYISGLGLYTAYLNGQKIGDRFLTPLFNDYSNEVRYQTYDITPLLKPQNILEISLGNGWALGRFGIDGGDINRLFDNFMCCAKITYLESDVFKIIETDDSWSCYEGNVTFNNIYDGEHIDDTIGRKPNSIGTKIYDKPINFVADSTPPVVQKHVLKPTLYISPIGERILDFNQNCVGFVRFKNTFSKGAKITLSYSELLQEGCFYRDNLRTAKAEFSYISNGNIKTVFPNFSFYGFRYVKIDCQEDFDVSDFEAVVIYSDLASTLEVSTDNQKINQLMQNALWGQRGNFLDVPTDCPQRDERLGWTADAQVFMPTACYNMESYSFYKKYISDLFYDQQTYYNGDFPMYSPSLKGAAGRGGAVWADAGIIMPYLLYQNYGDINLLKSHYKNMCRYVEQLIEGDILRGDGHVLTQPFTFGDWLAQDGICAQSLKGGTDDNFIRSVYYYNSVDILLSVATVLKNQEDIKKYDRLKNDIKQSIINEYFSKNGRLALDTQTAYVLCLHFGIYTNKQKVIDAFTNRLKKDLNTLKTGFVGTPLLLNVLFNNNLEDVAYKILFNQKCPGWLYQVNMGATTIWERWNSVLEDGKISGIFMNSLNHYAYGSVCQAIYSNIFGLTWQDVGFKKVVIAPKISYRLKDCSMQFNCAYGTYKIAYKIRNNNEFSFSVHVPFGCSAIVELPFSNKPSQEISSGSFQFNYTLNKNILSPYSADSLAQDILLSEKASAIFKECLPQMYHMTSGDNLEFSIMSIREMGYMDMFGAKTADIDKADQLLKKIVEWGSK